MKKMIVLSLMISSIAFATEAKKVETKAAAPAPAVATTTEVKANPCEGLKEKELTACEAKAKTHGKEAKAHAKNEEVKAPAKK